jgi:hypothetical protein
LCSGHADCCEVSADAVYIRVLERMREFESRLARRDQLPLSLSGTSVLQVCRAIPMPNNLGTRSKTSVSAPRGWTGM